jgi:hypothetical protein
MIKLHTAISRVTTRALPPSFGKDKGRWLTVTLVPGNGDEVEDLITIRPHGTRRPETISLEAVYLFALRSRVNKEMLERARERKAAVRRSELIGLANATIADITTTD